MLPDFNYSIIIGVRVALGSTWFQAAVVRVLDGNWLGSVLGSAWFRMSAKSCRFQFCIAMALGSGLGSTWFHLVPGGGSSSFR